MSKNKKNKKTKYQHNNKYNRWGVRLAILEVVLVAIHTLIVALGYYMSVCIADILLYGSFAMMATAFMSLFFLCMGRYLEAIE